MTTSSTSGRHRPARAASTTVPHTVRNAGRGDPAARGRLVDQLITDALRTGAAPAPDRARDGYVPTPEDLADELCDVPNTDLRFLPAGAVVLEPSAGDGALVAAIRRANPAVRVVAVEPNPVRAAVCTADHQAADPAVQVHTSTFEQYAARATADGIMFDGVVMNPPFALPDDPHIWLDHVRMAWHLLRPGGWLVAVVPDSLSYRSGTQHADARAFIEHHGSHHRLPTDAFAASGSMSACRVVRLTKPLPGAATGTEHLLSVPQHQPVRVTAPQLTAAAAVAMPVQVWFDGWSSGDRTMRYQGRCVLCRWLLWGRDDGDNDPRGVLGPFSAGLSLDPAEFGMAGPTVGLCPSCASNGAGYRTGYQQARQHWTTPHRSRPGR
ncbi:class I SAM-dependent methyltransferase [Dactylosporangium sp. NPDC051485]|uniref:class I SAM-dependent methyltransferase n=1 Tax=Dactylosporangium sp. NPDC051485 TaxID=3154846 RepID=UPI0034140EE6